MKCHCSPLPESAHHPGAVYQVCDANDCKRLGQIRFWLATTTYRRRRWWHRKRTTAASGRTGKPVPGNVPAPDTTGGQTKDLGGTQSVPESAATKEQT